MKVGILGSGKIVLTALAAMQQIPHVTCEALFVREQSRIKGEELQQNYEIARLYTDLNDFLADDLIDVIYIAVINNLHYEYAKTALLAGKHVICEKPFTSNAAEMAELVTIARQKGLFLFEAITLLHSPNYQYIQSQLPHIGAPKLIQANYSQYSSRYPDYANGIVQPAFDPSLSGGALYDINIYNVHFVVGLLGQPKSIQYTANIGFNGIDTSGVLVLVYDECIAVCGGAKDSQSPNFAMIQGTEGYLRLTSAANIAAGVETSIHGKTELLNFNLHENHMVNEFETFADIWAQQDHQRCEQLLSHSEIVMQILTTARQQAGIKFPADEA